MQEKEETTGENTRKLISSIDNLAGKLSRDIDLIAAEQKNPDGTEVELSNKMVDTFLKMVERIDKIKNYLDVVRDIDVHKGSIVTVNEELLKDIGIPSIPEPVKIQVIKPGENSFEAAINHAKNKNAIK